MAMRIGLSSMGMGRLIGLGLVFAYIGLHKVGEAVGLLDSPPARHETAAGASHGETQSLAERDAEVKRMIAARSARAIEVEAEQAH
jgi:hypothetical protein